MVYTPLKPESWQADVDSTKLAFLHYFSLKVISGQNQSVEVGILLSRLMKCTIFNGKNLCWVLLFATPQSMFGVKLQIVEMCGYNLQNDNN